MPDSSHTEQPTKRRLDRAREDGNFPQAREFVSAVHFIGFIAIAATFSGAWLLRTARLTRGLISLAFSTQISAESFTALARNIIAPEFIPLILAGFALTGLILCAQLGTTGLGISLKKLAPDINRFNVINRLKGLPGQNLPVLFQALALLPLVGAVVYFEVTENLDSLLELSWMGPQSAALRIGSVIETLLWRAAGLFLVIGLIDLFWQRRRYTRQLKMTKQEVREELKEQEGNPQMKMRIRRIQRDMARRNMMKEVATATAVIVNPTHYAVAVRYSMDSPGAPKVVAKGKNYLAKRIRERAIQAEVPIVENPPLARALYSSVNVGQEIPAHLYRAVAEILAYIYKLMSGR